MTYRLNKFIRIENGLYIVLWGLLFAAIPLSLYLRTLSDPYFQFFWADVFLEWRRFIVFLILFLVHNFLLAPLLVPGHRRMAYFTSVAVVAVAYAVFHCSTKAPRPPFRGGFPPRHHPSLEQPFGHKPHHHHQASTTPLRGKASPHPSQKGEGEVSHFRGKSGGGNPLKGGKASGAAEVHPPFFDEHDILALAVLLLMFGANLGIKVYFRSHEDRKRLSELEKQNLEQQLEYLRYQINPHFFMNTLNNIHALVDIDPQKAKSSIVELSKMMRYVLYEGNKQSVPLSQELDFIRHYTFLMQLRYTDKVKIRLDLPTGLPDCRITPLILITFIENAFKHGISYQKESFVEVKVAMADGRLNFTCSNSKAGQPAGEKGGVGLANVSQRLDLLFGTHYTLDIRDTPETYTATLNIPLS